MADKKKVRFIRKNGRIIPIRSRKPKRDPIKDASVFGVAATAVGVVAGLIARKKFKMSSSLFKAAEVSKGVRSFVKKGTKESKLLAKDFSFSKRKAKRFSFIAGGSMALGGLAAQTLAEIGTGKLFKDSNSPKGEIFENITGSAAFIVPFLIGRSGTRVTGLRKLLKKRKFSQAFEVVKGTSAEFGRAEKIRRTKARATFRKLKR